MLKHASGIEISVWNSEFISGFNSRGESFTAFPAYDESGDSYFIYEGDQFFRKDFLTKLKPAVKHGLLDISTGHLKPETITFLDEQLYPEMIPSIVVYEKGAYGYFLPIIERPGLEYPHHVWPPDLQAVYEFAKKAGCSWIMFDNSGTIYEDLPFWE